MAYKNLFLIITLMLTLLILAACSNDTYNYYNDPADADDDSADADIVDGDAVDGDTVDGDTVDGDTVDGDTVDGDAVDGDIVDGDIVDGGDADADADPDVDGDVETNEPKAGMVGAACTRNDDCGYGDYEYKKKCLDTAFLTGLGLTFDGEVEGGYCSVFTCKIDGSDGTCLASMDAFCFSLVPLAGTILGDDAGLCTRLCQTDADCRADEDQVCFDPQDLVTAGLDQAMKDELFGDTKMCMPQVLADAALTAVAPEDGDMDTYITNVCTPNPCSEANKTVCIDDGLGGYICNCDVGYHYDSGTCVVNVNGTYVNFCQTLPAATTGYDPMCLKLGDVTVQTTAETCGVCTGGVVANQTLNLSITDCSGHELMGGDLDPLNDTHDYIFALHIDPNDNTRIILTIFTVDKTQLTCSQITYQDVLDNLGSKSGYKIVEEWSIPIK